jgi:opacity protein-like surface antigen
MKCKLILAGVALLLASAARAANVYTPVTLAPSSFNADVVVEKTAAPPIENYVTASLDGGTNLTGNGWFEQGYYPSVATWGLPPHGTMFAAQ